MELKRCTVQTVFLASWFSVSVAAAMQGPLGPELEIGWSHAPYEVGECSLCHERSDPESPGGVTGPVNELCYGCHEDFREMMSSWESIHFVAELGCTICHNAHNSEGRKLLLGEANELCTTCHGDIWILSTESEVTHGAVTSDAGCMNCHNPHASHVEKLLLQLPYDLCSSCHSTDDLEDDQGRLLTNIGRLIAENPELHGPVAAGDCSSCHTPHGGENFRLLVNEYPAKFYAPYDLANYALCFICHDSRIVAEPKTDVLTNFRDGDLNLHYLHVNMPDNGRTCRACHEVHAAEQIHIIRDGVPYGSSGWILPINFEPLPNGGRCQKTCHATRQYDRTIQMVDLAK